MIESVRVSSSQFESVQALLLKLALQMARDDYIIRKEKQRQGIEIANEHGQYKRRQADTGVYQHIIALRTVGMTISTTASVTGRSIS